MYFYFECGSLLVKDGLFILKTKIGFGEYGSNTEIIWDLEVIQRNTDLENMRFGDMLRFGDTLNFGNYIIGDVQGKKLDAAHFARAFQGLLSAKHSVCFCWIFCSSKTAGKNARIQQL